ncbi:glycosyltransferase [Arsenicicoccus sp. oral taxon 190]|uniref:glycosyltransferase n=1 Tax=Arsenicicoccus sp. oral taxon 190 TaxID=1658671 RepID=UPI00067A3AE8|nr:glycosyltransferase [Arsenicicoccus sp. oral taxon 190]AKT50871.1 hypothetical protein ADJ73_05340 [Arsenicicoccus sp. oral taxon 190]
MRRPVIRLATRIFAPEVGAAAFRERVLADALAACGAQVEVLTSIPPAGHAPYDDGELRVRRWPALRDAGGNIRGYVQYLSYDLPLLVRMLSRRPADAYVVEPPPTTGAVMRLVATVHRRPYVWYAADVWSEAAGAAGAPAVLVRALRLVESAVIRGARLVLAISDEVAAKVQDLGARPDQVLVVGNGIDTGIFRPDGEAATAPSPYFVYTGTMSEWQGAGVFVEALARHRARGHDSRLVFLGQGSELPRLQALAEQVAPGAVDFLGVVPPTESARHIRGAVAALVSIKPGLGYDFAKPTKMYAATGCGIPVIFAGQGASEELVRSEALGWVSPHDPDAVADALDAAVTGSGRPDPEHLVAWTEANASLVAKARVAAEAILDRI